MPACNSNKHQRSAFFARHPGEAGRFHEVAKLIPMLFGFALALALAWAPALADGLPAASLQQPGMNLMPWSAYVLRHKCHPR